MLGNNREIFFPKLAEEQMMTFDKIATNLLRAHGYEAIECESDEEAIDKAEALKSGSKFYPVHFSYTNTSGEKAYEEFFTDDEKIDMLRLESLGVIIDKQIPDRESIAFFFRKLKNVFDKEETTKEEVVNIIEEYLPNFRHIETGIYLDGKM